MEAKELRIGNIFGFGEMIHEATHWDIRNLRVQELKGENSLTYKPVPLTEEWLLKFGFETSKWDDNNSLRKMIGSNDYTIVFYSNDICEIGGVITKKIEFVHQLQNLYFALTGEELTIK
jgi:hypothetical protein